MSSIACWSRAADLRNPSRVDRPATHRPAGFRVPARVVVIDRASAGSDHEGMTAPRTLPHESARVRRAGAAPPRGAGGSPAVQRRGRRRRAGVRDMRVGRPGISGRRAVAGRASSWVTRPRAWSPASARASRRSSLATTSSCARSSSVGRAISAGDRGRRLRRSARPGHAPRWRIRRRRPAPRRTRSSACPLTSHSRKRPSSSRSPSPCTPSP